VDETTNPAEDEEQERKVNGSPGGVRMGSPDCAARKGRHIFFKNINGINY